MRTKSAVASIFMLFVANFAHAAPMSAASTQTGAAAALDACLTALSGAPGDASALRRAGVDKMNWYTGAIVHFSSAPSKGKQFDPDQIRIQIDKENGSKLNGDGTGRVIYAETPQEKQCKIYFFKTDLDAPQSFSLMRGLLQQRGWIRVGRSDNYSKGEQTLLMRRGQIRDVLLYFTFRP